MDNVNPSTETEVIENLDALVAGVAASEAAEAEVVKMPALSTDATEASLEAAVAGAETTEHYEALEAGAPIVAAADAEAKPKSKKAKKLKTPAAPRITFAAPSAKILHKLGAKADDMLVLESGDAALDAAALAVKRTETLGGVDKLAKKVGEKAVQLFDWLGKGGALNEVMARGFKVLARDGCITSGDKGSVQTDLIGKYTIGTARSQANQLFCLFPALKITKIDSKGKQTLNPDSVIFAQVKAALSI